MNVFMTLMLCVFDLLALTSAAPVSRLTTKRDVYVPAILYPNKPGIVWHCGQMHNVTWDISSPPQQITNSQGAIYLVRNHKIDFNHTLAKGFDILKGRQEIEVPKLATGDYQLLLMGDSGNQGHPFRIEC